MPRTKIVCTIGPSSEDEETLRAMVCAGMDVARLNFSHGDHADHAKRIALIRRLAEEEGKVIAIMGDLQGPRLRLGEIEGAQVVVEKGQEVPLVIQESASQGEGVPLPYPQLATAAQPGQRIFLADGEIELRIREITRERILAQVVAGGLLHSRQGVVIPGVDLGLPCLTEKDKADLAFALAQGVDYIALSFVGSAKGIEELRHLIGEQGEDIPIVAKIEKGAAVEAFSGILKAADGIMVARGDLGVETSIQEVPIIQKEIIRQCNQVGKPVITATQMLESMIRGPRPTRAEASDVANAIFDGTDAVMLSGETAIGAYPVECVEVMAAIAERAERNFPYREWTERAWMEPLPTITDAVSQATCAIAYELGAKAIITTTASGYTARMVAKHRPQTPIIAVTARDDTLRRLALVWGVSPLRVEVFLGTDELISTSVEAAQKLGMVEQGDIVVITAGVPLGEAGRTNMIKVHRIE